MEVYWEGIEARREGIPINEEPYSIFDGYTKLSSCWKRLGRREF